MYIKNPKDIETNSMDIIDHYLVDTNFKKEELNVVKRMIHTTGDVEYRKIIEFQNDFINKAREALKKGGKIYADTNMIVAGVNKTALKKANVEVLSYVSDGDVIEIAKKEGITRSMAGVRKAIYEGIKMFAFGNAPTALYALLEEVDKNMVDPYFIIGVPVGFVGAKESKEHLTGYKIPYVRTNGNKGGSNVCVSVINALLYDIVERDF